jgi:polyhydroxyalkanoate synthesis regulator phasin
VQRSQQTALRQLAAEAGRSPQVESVRLVYEPGILAAAELRFSDPKRRIDTRMEKIMLAPASEDVRGVDWERAQALPMRFKDLGKAPERVPAEQGPFFTPAPEVANSAAELKAMQKDLAEWLFYNSSLPIAVHPELGLAQNPGEADQAFQARLQLAARERRDAEVDALKEKYTARIDRLQERLAKKERELAADEADHAARSREELVGVGETVLGLFMGRRATRSISRAASKRRITSRSKIEVQQTQEEVADLQKELADLEEELKAATDEIAGKWENVQGKLSSEELKPKRSDVDVQMAALAWAPAWQISYSDAGRTRTTAIPAYPQP